MYTIAVTLIAALLTGCGSIRYIGDMGPAQLPVYYIKASDSMAATRMLAVTDKDGKIQAYVGGTVPGAIPTAIQGVTGLAQAAALGIAGVAIKKGLEGGGKALGQAVTDFPTSVGNQVESLVEDVPLVVPPTIP